MFASHRMAVACLALAMAGLVIVAKAEEPPYKRLLAGEEAKKAADTQARIRALEKDGDYAGAIKTAEDLLALRQKLQGADHYQTLFAKWRIVALQRVGALSAGDRAAWNAVLKKEPTADALSSQGKPTEALAVRWELFDAHVRVLGDEHPDTVLQSGHVARALEVLGKYAEAEAIHRQSIAVTRKTLGEDNVAHATFCDALAMNLFRQNKLNEAEQFSRIALSAARRVLGDQNEEVAAITSNQAVILQTQGKYAEAELVARQGLRLLRECLGEEHFQLAGAYTTLGFALVGQARYVDAEPLVRQALQIMLTTLGEQHPNTVQGYNNLGAILHNQQKYVDAEPIYRQVLVMREKILPPDHPDVALACNNLGLNLVEQRQFAAADPLLRRAMAIWEKSQGERHPNVALACNNLALNLLHQGRYAEAEPLYRRALANRRAALGDDHPSTLQFVMNLADNLVYQGKQDEAREMLEKCWLLTKKVLGEHHPQTAQSARILATVSYGRGRYDEALVHFQASAGSFKAPACGPGPPAWPASPLQSGRRRGPTWPSVWRVPGIRSMPGAALESHLGRGLLDELAAYQPRTLPASDATRRDDLDRQLATLGKQIVPLVLKKDAADADRGQLERLLRERRGAESELNAMAIRLAQGEMADLASVQANLPADTAWLTWLDLSWKQGLADPLGDHWACVLRQRGDPAWIRLRGTGAEGAWTPADNRLAGEVRRVLGSRTEANEVEAAELLRRLAAQRWVPLEAHLQGDGQLPKVKRLIVTTTSMMAGIPVEALTDQYLVSYVPSATLLARFKQRGPSSTTRNGSLLALGDPDFREGGKAPTGKPLDVAPLPGSRREVEAIATLFKKADTLLGSDASEQRLEQLASEGKLKQYQVLHLATHGQIDPARASQCALLLARDQLPDPLKQAQEGKKLYDGKLDVGEILANWQLNAELVVLSACETGLGTEGGGEGLLGFSQAMLSRGARSLLVSLWPVHDVATALLMVRFYENWLGKRAAAGDRKSKAEALADAKTWLRNLTHKDVELLARQSDVNRGLVLSLPREEKPRPDDKPFAHPFFWSAFVLNGDPE